jgi:hypothetical protein
MHPESVGKVAESRGWELLDVRDAAARQSLAEELAGMAAEPGAFTPFHDLVWLLEAEGRTPDNVQVYVCRANGVLVAYAPFVVQPWTMRFRMGEVTLFSRAFERLHIGGGPIFALTDVKRDHAEQIADLFGQLRPQLTDRQIVYIEGVIRGGATERALTGESARRMFNIIEPASGYERRLIRFPSNYEEYLRSLKAQTRQNLRNTQRKLEKHLPGGVRLACFAGIDQIPEFVRRAVAVSKKTYQWRLLGLGLRNGEELEKTLSRMASQGWTRCYLLECAGAATAFMIGYLYAGTYYYVDVGFDPEWEKWSVGTVLHMEVLRDLMDGDAGARSFDFSSGTGIHKKRFGNESRDEIDCVLVPRSARNSLLIGAYRGMNAVSAVGVGLLERLHLKAAVKRIVRRHATDRATAE